MAAIAAETTVRIVGKAELAATLGWGRERLDRKIQSDANFPVRKRASKGVPWEFDVAEVKAYLAASADEALAGAAQTPRARREIAQAEAIERKNQIAAGELVELEPLRNDLTLMFSELGKSLDELPLEIVKRLGLPEESHKLIQEMVDERRRAMISAMDRYLPDGDE